MSAPLTPGAYLKLRLKAAGLSPRDVARRLETEPRLAEHARVKWIKAIEADAAPATFNTIAALRQAFDFDLGVLAELAVIALGGEAETPSLCRDCGASIWCGDDRCSSCRGGNPGFSDWTTGLNAPMGAPKWRAGE